MGKFTVYPNKEKKALQECKRLEVENRTLQLQLSNALSMIPDPEPEPELCNSSVLKKQLEYQESTARGHANLKELLGSLGIVRAFRCEGKWRELCILQEIQKINAEAAAGHVAFTKYCIADCEMEGTTQVRQQMVDEIRAMLDGADPDEMDPMCRDTICRVIGEW